MAHSIPLVRANPVSFVRTSNGAGNECAKALIQSGIREVIYYEDKYPDSDSVIASKRMFDLVGITYKHYEKSGRSVALQL